MRYKILGDVSKIRFAVLYASKPYVSVDDYYKPIESRIGIHSKMSDLDSFLEYNFNYKTEKGSLQDFNIYNILDDSTIELLDGNTDNLDALSSVSRSFVMQLSDNTERKSKDYFVFLSLVDSSELLLDLDESIRRVEFFDSVLTDDYLSSMTEYSEASNQLKPELYIDFGPEIIYKDPNDNNYGEQFYVGDVPQEELPNSFTDQEFLDYLEELDELINRKLLIGTITSYEDLSQLNLSLSVHSGVVRDPYRNQSDYVVSNKHAKSTKKLLDFTESKFLVDPRSLTYLSTSIIDKSKLVIYNDKVNRVLQNSEVLPGYTAEVGSSLPIFKKYIPYNYGDKVVHLGLPYMSLIDGNIGQNPAISPFWDCLYEEFTPDEEDTDEVIITTSSNNPDYGVVSPYGMTRVVKGESKTISITPNPGHMIKFIYVNGELWRRDEFESITYTFENVTEDQLLYVVFQPDILEISVESNPPGAGKVGFHNSSTGDDSVITYGDLIDLYVEEISVGFKFDGWYKWDYDLDREVMISDGTHTAIEADMSTTYTAKFSLIPQEITYRILGSGFYVDRIDTVYYGLGLSINLKSDSGYELFSLRVDGKLIERSSISSQVDHEDPKCIRYSYSLESITSDTTILAEFRRPSNWIEIDGHQYSWVTIGNYDWLTRNLLKDSEESPDLDLGSKYSLSELSKITNITGGFTIPDSKAIQDLISSVLTSDYSDQSSLKYNRVNISDSYSSTIYSLASWELPGMNNFLFSLLPTGYVDGTGSLVGWSTDNNFRGSVATLIYSDNGSYKVMKMGENDRDFLSTPLSTSRSATAITAASLRLCRPTRTEKILSEEMSYKVVKIGTRLWMNENLKYIDSNIGYHPEDSSHANEVYYSHDEVSSINSLLDGTGWRVATEEDFESLLNDYIVTRRTSGKRLKNSSTWDGFTTEDSERSHILVPPTSKLIRVNESWQYHPDIAFYVWQDSSDYSYYKVAKDSPYINKYRYVEPSVDKLSIRLVKDE